jgi:hypothetical protein
MKDSLYEIPDGCICMGDGLMGMACTAEQHARLKMRNGVTVQHSDRGVGVVLHAGQTISRVFFPAIGKKFACWNVDLTVVNA